MKGILFKFFFQDSIFSLMITSISKYLIFGKCSQFFLKLFFLVYTLFCSFFLCAQDNIRVEGHLINNSKFSKVVIQKFGIGAYDIAAVEIDSKTSKFSVIIPFDVEPGVYRFKYSQTESNEYLDIIINGKEKSIVFTIDLMEPIEQRHPVFLSSDENIAWFEFLKKLHSLQDNINVKMLFLSKYNNKSDRTFKIVSREYEKSKINYIDYRNDFINKSKFYWAVQMAKYTDVFFPSLDQHWRLQQFYEHQSFWSSKPTDDSLLINTPLYTDAVLKYLKYYMRSEVDYSEEEILNGFKRDVDTLIMLFKGNSECENFIIRYLQLGFREIGNEHLLQYIDEKYAKFSQCTFDDNQLQNRLKGYEVIKYGNLAPEILLVSNDGKSKTLMDFKEEKIVVVFWASWCQHCMLEMPKLEELASSKRNILFLTISLDDDFLTYQETIKNFPSMLHYCDLQKWKSKVVADFFVSATPTFFLLDESRVIIGRFSNVSQLVESISN